MIYGQNVYFLPRTLVSENKLLGEGDQSRFDSYHEIEAYIDTANYVSSSTVFSKFGIEIRDQIVLIMSDRKSTRLNSSHSAKSRMPSSA